MDIQEPKELILITQLKLQGKICIGKQVWQ
jgi:hypothetical protein